MISTLKSILIALCGVLLLSATCTNALYTFNASRSDTFQLKDPTNQVMLDFINHNILTMAAVSEPPFMMIEKDANGVVQYTCLLNDLLRTIITQLYVETGANYSIRYYRVAGDNWGWFQE